MRRGVPAVALVLMAVVAGCGSEPTASAAADSAAPSAPFVEESPGERISAERIAVEPLGALRPPQPQLAPAFEPGLLADHCLDRDVPAPPATDAHLTVLDRSYALAPSHVPDDLVPASAAGFVGPQGERLVRAVMVDDLAALRRASREAGHAIILTSAYRSHREQAFTFDLWVRSIGYGAALQRAARPGHSEHQLGTALDFVSPGWEGRVGDWARDSADGAWLAANAWRYGFVMSYPDGFQAETCFAYEPWHYRWVGRAAAAEQREEGLPLRTYLARFVSG
jgi:zinc D-Ala-D-Ala carboxypeptidase